MKRKLAMFCVAVMGMTSVFGTIGCGFDGNEGADSMEMKNWWRKRQAKRK